jgi:hypothetical protein
VWRRAEAGLNEQFDLARFGEWIEGLVAGGDTQAATIVSRIDSRLVAAGLSGHVRVFDPAALSHASSVADDAPDGCAAPYSGLSVAIGGYVVRSRFADSWDAVVALLLALDEDHRDYFHAVMRECRGLSNSRPEIDGLDDLLTGPDQLLHDVGLARRDRRSRQGFLTPSEARAFLQMARQPHMGCHSQPRPNPIADTYLRAGEEAASPAEVEAAQPDAAIEAPMADEIRESVDAAAALLAEAVRSPERPRALPGGPTAHGMRGTRVQALMEVARLSDERVFLARSREVAFLANALVAGSSLQARPFTPQEASNAALAACNLGIELWPSGWPEHGAPEAASAVVSAVALPDSFLSNHDLLTAFEVGWASLHDTSLFVAQQLVEVLKHVQTLDTKTHEGLVILRRDLMTCCQAQAPWRARDALDVLAILDPVAWTGLLGVLDECPVVPDALTAIVERRTRAVSATEFAFISSTDQIAAIRGFAGRLADIFMGP